MAELTFFFLENLTNFTVTLIGTDNTVIVVYSNTIKTTFYFNFDFFQSLLNIMDNQKLETKICCIHCIHCIHYIHCIDINANHWFKTDEILKKTKTEQDDQRTIEKIPFLQFQLRTQPEEFYNNL